MRVKVCPSSIVRSQSAYLIFHKSQSTKPAEILQEQIFNGSSGHTKGSAKVGPSSSSISHNSTVFHCVNQHSYSTSIKVLYCTVPHRPTAFLSKFPPRSEVMFCHWKNITLRVRRGGLVATSPSAISSAAPQSAGGLVQTVSGLVAL